MEIPPETIPLMGFGARWAYIRVRAHLTGTNSEPHSATVAAVNPLAIDHRVDWRAVAVMEVTIYGDTFHHGFGVDCRCSECHPPDRMNRRQKTYIAVRKWGIPETNRAWYDTAWQILQIRGFVNHAYCYDMLTRFIQGRPIDEWDREAIEHVVSLIGMPPQK